MEKTNTPLFTIITSTLNMVNTVERCVESVAAQTFRDYEHIVVDGASTDGTVEFLNSKRDYFSVLISEPDTGIYNAWNKALKHARGEWVLFLGADDILADKDVLGDVAGFIEEQEATSGIVYGDVMLVTKGSYEERELKRVLPEELRRQITRKGYPELPCHSGIFHHKLLLEKCGPFDESYRICADAKLLLTALCKEDAPALRIPKVIYKMTMGGISSAMHSLSKEKLRILKELECNFSLIAISKSLCNAYLNDFNQRFFGRENAHRIRSFIRLLKGRPLLPK